MLRSLEKFWHLSGVGACRDGQRNEGRVARELGDLFDTLEHTFDATFQVQPVIARRTAASPETTHRLSRRTVVAPPSPNRAARARRPTPVLRVLQTPKRGRYAGMDACASCPFGRWSSGEAEVPT